MSCRKYLHVYLLYLVLKLQILKLIAPEFRMPIERECPTCHGKVATQEKECPFCHTTLKKPRGRPKGTTTAMGFSVGKRGGRPKGTTEARGFNVGKRGGRPKGTTAARGFGVGRGRPKGTTEARGFKVGKRGGRPKGSSTSEALRLNVAKHSGHPKGTNEARGINVGKHGDHPKGTSEALEFNSGKDILVTFSFSSNLYVPTAIVNSVLHYAYQVFECAHNRT